MFGQARFQRFDTKIARTPGGIVRTIAMFIFLSPTLSAEGGEPTLDDCLEAPAPVLARSYLADRYVLQDVLPMVEQGFIDTMVVGRDHISGKNAAKFRKRLENRLANYGAAIERRGAVDLSGRYAATASEACERAGSLWIGVILEPTFIAVRIDQAGADATLSVEVEIDGKQLALDNRAAVVESAIAVSDSMNPDYFALGTRSGGRLVIRPDPAVLGAWPGWASPPKRADIEACEVVLELLPVAPVGEHDPVEGSEPG